MLDPLGKEINAIEGRVVIPRELEVISVNSGNSLVSLWIEKPNPSGSGEIVFSGVMPGGYLGELGPFWEGYHRGEIFKVMFKPVATGQVEILTKDFSALLNDGLGTKTNLNLKSHLLVIKSEIQAPLENISEDREAPEKFSVEIIKNENLFENQWALVFSAQDKGSGINHYEVRETSPYLWQRFFQSRWQVTEDGPYLLKDQNLNSLIKVKAIDNLGNEKESIIQAQNTIFWYQDQSRWVIMISVILSVFFLRKALFGWFLKCNKV